MNPQSHTDNESKVRFIGEIVKIDGETTTLRIYKQYCRGLRDIESYSHLIILYWAHLRDSEDERRTVLVVPKRHERRVKTGVFACRSPSRPNPICLCVVELLEIQGCSLKVKGLDAELQSPVVDIKPYHPQTDSVPHATFPRWLANLDSVKS